MPQSVCSRTGLRNRRRQTAPRRIREDRRSRLLYGHFRVAGNVERMGFQNLEPGKSDFRFAAMTCSIQTNFEAQGTDFRRD